MTGGDARLCVGVGKGREIVAGDRWWAYQALWPLDVLPIHFQAVQEVVHAPTGATTLTLANHDLFNLALYGDGLVLRFETEETTGHIGPNLFGRFVLLVRNHQCREKPVLSGAEFRTLLFEAVHLWEDHRRGEGTGVVGIHKLRHHFGDFFEAVGVGELLRHDVPFRVPLFRLPFRPFASVGEDRG